MTRMRWDRSSPHRWSPTTKYEPTPDEIARAAAKREQARRETKAGIKPVIVEPDAGVPCPRCAQPTEIRTHPTITAKMLRQPFYYRQWFYCHNPMCRTTTIMRDEDRVFIEDDVDAETQARMAMIREQLRPRD